MLTKQQILEALRKWINQRPGLEFENYGDWGAYRAELRGITRTRSDALQLLRAVSGCESITADNLIEAFPRAYSGRLAISETKESNTYPGYGKQTGGVYLGYCTGQYWPTEYRAAACAVLAHALWGAAQASMLEPDGQRIKKTFGVLETEFDSIEGLPPGDWLRRYFRREFGRGIALRWFN